MEDKKTKKITIWSTKGGVGKTSICAELHFRLGFPVVTNERRSMLRFLVDGSYLKILTENEKIQDYDSNMLFDFGGYIDQRIVDALEQSDFVIIPTLSEIFDLQGTIDTLYTVEKYNKNIILIINKISSKKDIEFYQNVLKDFQQYKIFELNQSKAISNIGNYKLGIMEIINKNPLLKYVYRKINTQLENIIQHITI